MIAKPGKSFNLKWRPPGPVANDFFKSKAFIRGIRGPIGSGKSAACIVRLFATAMKQEPDANGVRRTRFAIIRNTYPELKSTTIKTWLDWFPEDIFGPMSWDAPITHTITLPHPDGTRIEAEVLFLAVDRPEDVKKLLSLELTAAFTNETRELPFAVIEGLTGRIGRYPSQRDKPEWIDAKSWPTERYLVMDTNSPSDRHWWYEMAEPSAKGHAAVMERMAPIIEELERMELISPGQPLMEFFAQPSGMSPHAENIANLMPGYYQFSAVGKTEEWINVHLKNEYGSTFSGKRVYPQYSDSLHLAKAKLFAIKGLPLRLSFDFGRTPCCVIGQLSTRGQLRTIAEITSEDMSLRQLIEGAVVPFLNENFPNHPFKEMIVTGDPAGDAKGQDEGSSCQEILEEFWPQYESAFSNDPTTRQEAVNYFLTRNIDGESAFRLSPECPTLREGFNGGYHYRRLKTNTSDVRFLEAPEKNVFSHPHDALQYLAMKAYRPQATKRPRSSSHIPARGDTATGY
ncbi:hypothetical protein [Variovorax sp. 278MFTsu5.1]|uniref:hypothetical protein n=1 Tax=Variovorax sp. 278MFTsu5.1 TaxID=3158366 RepID=UPI003AABE9CE